MATFAHLHDLAVTHPWASAASVAILSGTVAYLRSPHYKLRHIPTVGSSSWPLLSYISGRRYFVDALELLQEGYERHPGRMFKVTTMDQWIVVATGRTLVREIAAVPDHVMSFEDAVDELTQQKHILPKFLREYPLELEIIKRDLTRNLTSLFPDIYDEIEKAFDEYIPKAEDWTAMPAVNIAMMVVARASNRVLIGMPYCRNAEYLQRCITYTRDWSQSTQAVAKYPVFLKPVVAPFVNKLPATTKRVSEIISPEIVRRRKLMDEYGKDYPDKTNDLLTWMMDEAYGNPNLDTNSGLAQRLLQVNFAAIHTSSSTWTHALYTLAANPKWIAPLREEVEAVIAAEGMTKSAMQKMVQLDSFLRENNRISTIAGMAMRRKVHVPHTFSDGTYVPVGTIIGVPTLPHQMDGANYQNPNEFDPTRFVHAKEGEATRKHFATIDPEYLAFGIGKHACPGRFFAGNELKAMLAHLVIHYDVKAEVEGVRPANIHFAQSTMPNMQAKVLFRKRR